MLLQIGFIIFVVTLGVIFAASGMGSASLLTTFLAALGLISLLAVIALLILARKAKKRDEHH
ncbi:MAG: putative membrane protein YkvI [Paraglaciecola sp.]|jgi:uncharacterized membrane protein YkvI